MHRLPYDMLCQEFGISPAKAAQIIAALELGNRMKQSAEKQAIHSPKEAADLVLFEMSVLEQEELRVILLDTRNRLVSIEEIYRGSVNTSQVRVAELFKAAIRRNTPNLIVVHNRPSGDPTPSPVMWRLRGLSSRLENYWISRCLITWLLAATTLFR